MTNVPAKAQFAACECGSPSIVIPADIVDDAPVACGGCGHFIGTWLGYKSFVSRSISLEAHGFSNATLVCVDPIMRQPLAEALADQRRAGGPEPSGRIAFAADAASRGQRGRLQTIPALDLSS